MNEMKIKIRITSKHWEGILEFEVIGWLVRPEQHKRLCGLISQYAKQEKNVDVSGEELAIAGAFNIYWPDEEIIADTRPAVKPAVNEEWEPRGAWEDLGGSDTYIHRK